MAEFSNSADSVQLPQKHSRGFRANEGQRSCKAFATLTFFFGFFLEDYISVTFAAFDNSGRRHVAEFLGQIHIQVAAPTRCEYANKSQPSHFFLYCLLFKYKQWLLLVSSL